jgi:hypothetical protein
MLLKINGLTKYIDSLKLKPFPQKYASAVPNGGKPPPENRRILLVFQLQ